MNIRVTDQTRTSNAISNMQMRGSELATYQDQISSGIRVKKPSDDPEAYPRITQAKTASSRLETYGSNIDASTATLNASVSALQNVNDILVQARQIALQGTDANNSNDPVAREALATQVDSLIGTALAAANGRSDEQAIFGGTATDTTPFSVGTTDANGRPATIVYNGSPERARTITGRGTTVDTRYVGSNVFQQPGADVFASLISLRDHLRDNTSSVTASTQNITQDLANVDAARTSVGVTTGEQSSNLATLTSLKSVVTSTKTDTDGQIGDLEGTDYTVAVVKMQEAATALQAIYAVTAKLADPGLLSFIGN